MTHDIWSGQIPPVNTGTAPELASFPVSAEIRGEKASPAVLILPGGGYVHHAAHESEPVARWFNSLGIAAFVLKYRVRPDRHPAPLLDAKRAMRFIRHQHAQFGIDPDRLGVLGFSAGGHLAATVSVDVPTDQPPRDDIDRISARPDLAILCYPVVSFVETPGSGGSSANLLGAAPSRAMRELLSAERHVDAATPPTFLWHTADDAAVDVNNSLVYARALGTHSVPFELHVFPHGRHGLGLAHEEPRVAQWTELCAGWLDSLGWVSRAAARLAG